MKCTTARKLNIPNIILGGNYGDRKVYTQVGDCDCPDDCHVLKKNTKVNSWVLESSKYSVDEF